VEQVRSTHCQFPLLVLVLDAYQPQRTKKLKARDIELDIDFWTCLHLGCKPDWRSRSSARAGSDHSGDFLGSHFTTEPLETLAKSSDPESQTVIHSHE
jgi:hypothetical protein